MNKLSFVIENVQDANGAPTRNWRVSSVSEAWNPIKKQYEPLGDARTLRANENLEVCFTEIGKACERSLAAIRLHKEIAVNEWADLMAMLGKVG